MPLKAILANLDEVPEDQKSLYKEGDVRIDGKKAKGFYLDLEGVDDHPRVVNLKTAHESVKAKRDELQADLDALKKRLDGMPDDFSADALKELQAKLAQYEEDEEDDPASKKKKAEGRQLLEQRIAAMEKKHAEDLKKKDEEIASRDRTIEQLVVDEGLSKHLAEVGVSPKFMKAAKAMLRSDVKVERDKDGKVKATVETDLGPVPLDKYISEWAESDEGKAYVEKPKGAGANGDGGGGGRGNEPNPFDPKTPNLTKQGEILRQDRTLATQLMKNAGWDQSKIDKRLNAA